MAHQVDDELLEVWLANAFPELVRKGDQSLLQRHVEIAPTSMRDANSGDLRRHAARHQQRLARRLVIAAGTIELARVLDLADIVQDDANADELAVDGHIARLDRGEDQLGGLADELDVPDESRRRTQLQKQGPRIFCRRGIQRLKA